MKRCEALLDREAVEKQEPSLLESPEGQFCLSGEFARLREPLLRYFERATRDRSEAHDLTQEVFAKLLQRGRLDGYERFQGYVFATARSVLLDRQRSRKSRYVEKHVEFDADVHAGVEPHAEAMFIARETLEALDAALRRLPERTRAVFVLRRLEGMGYSEIALRLGVSISSVEKEMLRASRYLIACARELE